jgi:tRNA-2-methylthio-N6-dimethylallyladenosine synthase
MNRGYSIEDYTAKIDLLRREIPSISISTDLMVGFPGETADNFRSTIESVEKIEFDNAYTFRYSPREGTKAARYEDQVDPEVASERLSNLIELQRNITVKKNMSLVGSVFRVIVEGRAKKGDKMLLARTEGDKMVVFRGDAQRIGSLHRVKIVDTNGTTLIGELNGVVKDGGSPTQNK